MNSHIRYIAHRGNLNGPNPELENRPDYIRRALQSGFDVEIDVWFLYGEWWLGHDEPSYAVDDSFLLNPRLWLHAKHAEALAKLGDLADRHPHLNYFYHENDTVTLTSIGYVWTFPTKVPQMTSRTILVMPENHFVEHQYLVASAGVCSDHIANIHNFLPKLKAVPASVEMVLKPAPTAYGHPQSTWTEWARDQRRSTVYSLTETLGGRDEVRKTIGKTDAPVMTGIGLKDPGLVEKITKAFTNPEPDHVQNIVIEIVSDHLGIDKEEITRESRFISDLDADSLDAVELTMEFEDEFEMSVPDEEMEKCHTVGNAIDYIKAHMGENRRATLARGRRAMV
jgi:acyl carrier protein